jgi:hypothetical protein
MATRGKAIVSDLENVECGGVRIRIIRKPTASPIQEMQLSHFEVGQTYDVGFRVAELMLAEGWAEPAPDRADDKPQHGLKKDRERSH